MELERLLNERDMINKRIDSKNNDLEKILNKNKNTLFKSEKRIKSIVKKIKLEPNVFLEGEYIVFNKEVYIKLEKINGFKLSKEYIVLFLDGVQREVSLKKEDIEEFKRIMLSNDF